MTGKQLFEALTDIDDELIQNAISKIEKTENTDDYKMKRRKKMNTMLGIAASFAVLFGVSSLLPKNNIVFEDENVTIVFEDENVTVQAVDFSTTAITSSSADSAMLTEKEIFNSYNTDIFKGTVTDIENIEIDFDGEVVYRSIATIFVQDVYRGSLQIDEEVTILLPIPIDVNGFWVSGTDVISQISIGMVGIFMPLVLSDESAMWQENNVWFDKRKIVDYGLLDSQRFIFLETENDLVFAEWAFESISDAQTLYDIEEYILTMIE